MFKLHPQLKSDLVPIKELSLSLAFLHPNSENPWVILVPKVNDIQEWHQLNSHQQSQLNQEINKVSLLFEDRFKPDKINIGSLGNIVPQLHIHIIARFKSDKAWPGAIWGHSLQNDRTVVSDWSQWIKSKF